MNKWFTILIIICLSISPSWARIKIGSVWLESTDSTLNLLSRITEMLDSNPAIDLIIGPDCGLGGLKNRSRMEFQYFPDSITYSVADTFPLTAQIEAILDSLCILAGAYNSTIIPGPVWEVDSFNRVFQSVPIIGPDGHIKRVRRKLSRLNLNPLIDPTIRLDTIVTRDSCEYTYLITISNESVDLPRLYSSDTLADIWLLLQGRWVNNMKNVIQEIEYSIEPDYILVESAFPSILYDSLIYYNWVSADVPVIVSSLKDSSGAFWLTNLTEPDPDIRNVKINSYIYDELGAIIDIDPYTPDNKTELVIVARDTLGSPIESLLVSVQEDSGTFRKTSYTNLSGTLKLSWLPYADYSVSISRYGYIVIPEDTIITLNLSEPICTLNIIAYKDTTKPSAELFLHARDLLGDPTESLYISIRSIPPRYSDSKYTDVMGIANFQLDSIGFYVVSASKPEYVIDPSDTIISVGILEPVCTLNISAFPLTPAEIFVHAEDNLANPTESLHVSVYLDSSTFIDSSLTDSAGNVQFPIGFRYGEFTVSCFRDSYIVIPSEIRESLDIYEPICTLNFIAYAETVLAVNVHFQDTSGNPISNANVIISSLSPPYYDFSLTDSTGNAKFIVDYYGDYIIQGNHDLYLIEPSETTITISRSAFICSLVFTGYLIPPLGIFVYAHDTLGNPVDSLWLGIRLDTVFFTSLYTDTLGNAYFDLDRTLGNYTVYCSKPFYVISPTDTTFTLSIPNPVCSLEVVAYIMPPVKITVLALDTLSSPVESVFVRIRDFLSPPFKDSTYTSATGIAKFILGPYYWSYLLSFTKDSFTISPEDTIITLEMSSPECSLTVTVHPESSLVREINTEYNNEFLINIYISNSEFVISLPVNDRYVEIIDLNGKIVTSLQVKDRIARWHPSELLSSGIYFMRPKSGNICAKLIYLK